MARLFKRLAVSVLVSCALTLGILLTGGTATGAAFWLGIALGVFALYGHDWLVVWTATRRLRRLTARLGA